MTLSTKRFLILDDHEHMQLLPKERRRMLDNRFLFKLYARDYNSRFDYVLRVERWCEEHCTNFFYLRHQNTDYHQLIVYFLEPNDAVHFKLYWAGQPEQV